MGYTTIDSFYKLVTVTIQQFGATALITNFYHGSLIEAMQDVYTCHNWNRWKFQNVESQFWDNVENRRSFMDTLGKELEFYQMEDWYSISKRQIVDKGGISLLNKYGQSPSKLVMSVYTEHQWDTTKFEMSTQNWFKNWLNNESTVLK
jgi:hypothetical protein